MYSLYSVLSCFQEAIEGFHCGRIVVGNECNVGATYCF